MHESFENKMTEKFRQVLENYEAGYSAEAWEKLKPVLPPRPPFIFRILRNFKYWFPGIIITGTLIFILKTDLPSLNAVIPPARENSQALCNPENVPALQPVATGAKPVIKTRQDYLLPLNGSPSGNSTKYDLPSVPSEIHEESSRPAEKSPVESVSLPDVTANDSWKSFRQPAPSMAGYKMPAPGLLSLVPVYADPAPETPVRAAAIPKHKSAGFKFSFPQIGSLLKTDEDYNRFTGPQRIIFLYNPEIPRDKNLKLLGLSQGGGINIEGNLRHSVSVSAGIFYQSASYSKVAFSAKVPPHNLHIPADSINKSLYIDSVIVKSGRYSFVEIPLTVNLKLIETGKSLLALNCGFSVVICLGQKQSTTTRVGDNSTTSSVTTGAWSKISVPGSINTGLTFERSLSDRFSLIMSAGYKFGTWKQWPPAMQISRFSLQAGIAYKFGKRH